jgi:hypothetical protein
MVWIAVAFNLQAVYALKPCLRGKGRTTGEIVAKKDFIADPVTAAFTGVPTEA